MEKLFVEEVAKEIAAFSHDCDPETIFADEDMVATAEVLVDLEVRSTEGIRAMPSNVTDVASASPFDRGLHLSLTRYRLLQPRCTLCTQSASFIEVDIPAELKKRPTLRGLRRLLSPSQGMANSFPQRTRRGAVCATSFLPILPSRPAPVPV